MNPKQEERMQASIVKKKKERENKIKGGSCKCEKSRYKLLKKRYIKMSQEREN